MRLKPPCFLLFLLKYLGALILTSIYGQLRSASIPSVRKTLNKNWSYQEQKLLSTWNSFGFHSCACVCGSLSFSFFFPFMLSSLFLFLPHFFPLLFLFSFPPSPFFLLPSSILCNSIGRKIRPVDAILYFQHSSLCWGWRELRYIDSGTALFPQ